MPSKTCTTVGAAPLIVPSNVMLLLWIPVDYDIMKYPHMLHWIHPGFIML